MRSASDLFLITATCQGRCAARLSLSVRTADGSMWTTVNDAVAHGRITEDEARATFLRTLDALYGERIGRPASGPAKAGCDHAHIRWSVRFPNDVD